MVFGNWDRTSSPFCLCQPGARVAVVVAAARFQAAAVVCAYHLPEIDGGTVIQRIRADAALRHTPCVMLTGSVGPEAEVQALEGGADAFVLKSADQSTLVSRLAALLRTPVSGGETLPADAGLLAPKKVLVVDDSPTYRMTLEHELRREGYEVVAAQSGEESLALLNVDTFDAILLDLVMPGINGHETTRRIKGSVELRHVPLLLMTSQDTQGVMFESIQAGADDYVPKDSGFQVIKARLRAQLRRRQFEAEHLELLQQLARRTLDQERAKAAEVLAEQRAQHLAEVQTKNQELAIKMAELEDTNRELDAFTRTVSHDLRAPVRWITGFSQLLESGHGDALGEEGRRLLGRVQTAAARMADLIADLLELSRVKQAAIDRHTVDLAEVVQAIFSDLTSNEPGRNVELVLAAPVIEAQADPALIRIVLENLVGNAWKYTGKEALARIEFGVEPDMTPRTYYVQDNGAGFKMEFVGKLFTPFERIHRRSDFDGNGVGLATVRRIIERHGGEISGRGEPLVGARFSFTLPDEHPC